MKNIEKHTQSIYKQLNRKNTLKALTMFLTLSSIEKNKVRDKLKEEFDIDLSQKLPVVSKTIGGIELYRIDSQIKLLSSSILGNEYLKKILKGKEIRTLFREMINDYEEDLENAHLLKTAEKILENAKDDEVDFKDIKDFIEYLEEEDCEEYMNKLIKELKSVLDENDHLNLDDIFFNNRFKYINTMNRNLVAINLELSKINSLGFFLTLAIDERDFILIKPYSYSDIERLFFIGIDKFKENIFCPVCENKKKFSQYIDTNVKLVTVCNECSHTINSKEEF